MKKILKIFGTLFLIFIIIASLGMGYFIGNETFKGLTNIMPREETVKNISMYKEGNRFWSNFWNCNSMFFSANDCSIIFRRNFSR